MAGPDGGMWCVVVVLVYLFERERGFVHICVIYISRYIRKCMLTVMCKLVCVFVCMYACMYLSICMHHCLVALQCLCGARVWRRW